MRWLVWRVLVWLVLISAGCASTAGPRTEELLRRVEQELASLRAERASCAKELQAMRREQHELVASLDRRYQDVVRKVVNELVRSAQQALGLFAEGARRGATKPETKPEMAAEPDRSSESPTDAKSGPSSWIKKVRTNTYRVTRAGLDALLASSAQLRRGARIVPAVRDGAPSGFKIYAIRPGSFYHAIGLRNGDELETVNGMAFTTPDRALEVYTKVRTAKRITLSLRRQGKLLELVYTIEN